VSSNLDPSKKKKRKHKDEGRGSQHKKYQIKPSLSHSWDFAAGLPLPEALELILSPEE
jgi:hypothetical protein